VVFTREEGGKVAGESVAKRAKSKVEVDDPQSLSKVLLSVQKSTATSRPEIARITGLGRTLVAKHVDIALKLKIISEGDFGSSTGGRVPRLLSSIKTLAIS
jgi:hypothetical protein